MAKEISVDLSAGPSPLPKSGDTVNHVQLGNKIIQAKVVSVEKSGRTITIDGGAKGPQRLVFRPKGALAGNTWHWPAAMLLLLLSLAFAIVTPASAALPTYHTFSGYGNSTTPATVILPADPNSQIRIVSLLYTSDNAGAQFLFSSGTTAYGVMYTNALSMGATNNITSTNGLAGGDLLVLQHGGIDYTNTVASWGTYDAGTNTSGYVTNQAFVVTTTQFGTTGLAGDNIYLMSPLAVWYAGAATNAINGDDIFSGNFGRPVLVQLSPATTTNRLNSVSAHYDNAAQN